MKFKPKSNRPRQKTSDKHPFAKPEHKESAAVKNLVYGALPVLEALRANIRKVDKILIVEGIREARLAEVVELARRSSVPVSRVSRDQLTKLCGQGVIHQGVIAFTAAADYVDAEEMIANADLNALILVLDGVEDPQNLGAVLRVAECAGADGVIIPDRRAVGLTDSVAKASAGAIEYVKVAKVPNLNRLIESLKEKNIWVVGATGDAEMNYTDWDWKRPTALVLGGEGKGLHRLVAENCDVLVKIPMYGKIGSLNVSNAASVVLFEVRRQRAAEQSDKGRLPTAGY
jgi:23S rRNA (guanosine2251-2'-O)-methyltransferase